MTASLSASTAVLKRKYPKGEVPSARFQTFPLFSAMPKETDFFGEDAVAAIQNEAPQGVGANFQAALGSLYQSNYARFVLTRTSYYGVARITGEALEATKSKEGALVDLWDTETDGVTDTMMKMFETFAFGNGSGTLGQAASGTTGVTITLGSSTTADPSQAVYFDLNMRVGASSDATLSPTARTGSARITGIDRLNGTITTGSAFDAQITGLAANDYLVRVGDAASAGTAVVPFGLDAFLVGGTSPGTLLSLARNTDPVRFAGQTAAYTGTPIEEAIIDADARVGVQGFMNKKRVMVMNNRDVANLKKTLGAKREYDNSSSATVSFSKLMVEGENGPIEIKANPFCKRNAGYLFPTEMYRVCSLGPVPHLQRHDKNDMLRVANDDAVEARFVAYHQNEFRVPGEGFRLTGLGA